MAAGTGRVNLAQRYDYTITLAPDCAFKAQSLGDRTRRYDTGYLSEQIGKEIPEGTIMVEATVLRRGLEATMSRKEYFPFEEVAYGLTGRVIPLMSHKEVGQYLCAPGKEGVLFERIIGGLTRIYENNNSYGHDFGKLILSSKARAIPTITRAEPTELKAPNLEATEKGIRGAVWNRLVKEYHDDKTGFALRMKASEDSDETELVYVHPFMLNTFSDFFKLDETSLSLGKEKQEGSEVTIFELPQFSSHLIDYLLDFLYINALPSEKDVATLLQLIELYKHLKMKSECEGFYNHCLQNIESNLTQDTVMSVIHAAYTSENGDLLSVANRFLNREWLNLCSIEKIEDLLAIVKNNLGNTTDIIPLVCDHLREYLIRSKDPEVWITLYHFTKENLNQRKAINELNEVCIKLALQTPGISDKFLEEYPTKKLREMKGGEIRAVKKEAERISCEKMMKRIEHILNDSSSEEEQESVESLGEGIEGSESEE